MKPYYYVIESCMRPSGAYSNVKKYFDTLTKAREFFSTTFYVGPGYGIQNDKEIQLVIRNEDGEQKVLEQRKID